VSHFVALSTLAKAALAVLIIIATSWINYVGVRSGARVNNVTGAVKIVALIGLVVAGPLLGGGSFDHLHPLVPDLSAVPVRQFGLALSPVLFSYLGWNASVYVASEIHDPGRTIPRSLFAGLGLCTASISSVNVAYLYAVPLGAQQGNNGVGEAAARVFFGAAGGTIGAGSSLPRS
jgi:APA family basic amino acid/polyamine antiporter